MRPVWRALWRLTKAIAWRVDPLGAAASVWAPRGLWWRLSDALHGLAFPGPTGRIPPRRKR